jgi:RNase P/RNase MRP subunit p29
VILKGGNKMQELIGLNVKIALNDSHGFVSLIGEVKKIDQNFLLIESTIGPIYIPITSIKTIQVKGVQDE